MRRTTLLLSCGLLAAAEWQVGEPALLPGQAGSFDETAVKDPSIVRYADTWHVFYTARGRGQYSIGYVSAPTLAGLQNAPRHQVIPAYAAAPQIFYFRPQKRWYLIFQSAKSNYLPVYSTTATLDKPASWTTPKTLAAKDETAKWIDFWVLCDERRAYLYYTRGHQGVMVKSTTLAEFPHGWGPARKMLAPVHEAVHVYCVAGAARYVMQYEINRNKLRRFGLAEAPAPEGPWRVTDADFATGATLRYQPGAPRWTDEVSHGELIRAGYDERLEIPPGPIEMLIQGLPAKLHTGEYTELPWRLGLIRSAPR